MNVLADLLGLAFLVLVAYRGFSVILFAPVAAMIPVLLTHPSQVPVLFTSLYMEKTVTFVKLYFPIFLLGSVFGKLIELSGFATAIVTSVLRLMGPRRTIASVVLVCALLTYGGVSLFVVVFAVYPFAAEMFRRAQIPKRLLPATLALGAFSFTMDALPGTPQIQNIIPTTFFGTTAWAAPILGIIGSIFIFISGITYLQRQVRKSASEGYGAAHREEPEVSGQIPSVHPLIALLPLLLVAVGNKVFGYLSLRFTEPLATVLLPGLNQPLSANIATYRAVWCLEAALLLGIASVLAFGFCSIRRNLAEGTRIAAAGALLATMNTASEYGFGAVIAALPGFAALQHGLSVVPGPLLNAAVTTTMLSGVTGSASGGLSIALAAMSTKFIVTAQASHIPLAVLHRVTAMASGGMDCMPHNGAVITVLAVTGLTHRQSYRDIFAITVLKTLAVFVVIAVYDLTGLN